MRDYDVMRNILAIAARAQEPARRGSFAGAGDADSVDAELARLGRDGLLDGSIAFDASGMCTGGAVRGLTPEGREFFNLIENNGVWDIVLRTLEAANVDVSYPLLKEVCEEIVKRYVTSFIPDEIRGQQWRTMTST